MPPPLKLGAPFQEIRERHSAVLIATGVYKARDIPVPGVGLENVVPALDYLVASNRKGFGDNIPELKLVHDAANKNIVVIGGGDTAYGLRTHRHQTGCNVSHMPLPQRPDQYARVAA